MPRAGNAPPAAGEPDLRRAAIWLRRHRITGVAPTPLLAARLTARRHTRIGLAVAGGLLVLPYLAAQGWAWHGSPESTPDVSPNLAVFCAAILTVLLLRYLGMRWAIRSERRLAATLPLRAAHPVHIGIDQLLGPHLWFAVALRCGAVALVTAVIVTDPAAPVRTNAWIALAAMVAMAALAVVELGGIMRRPALAEDEASLRVDDVLRAEEAHLAASPVLSLLVIVQSGLPAWSAWPNLMLLPLLMLATVDAVLARDGVARRQRQAQRILTGES